MNNYINIDNYPASSTEASEDVATTLAQVLSQDFNGSFFSLLGDYKRTMNDNKRKDEWKQIHKKLDALFKCGKSVPLNGPMIGVSLSIRDSDYFKQSAELFGKERSAIANIEWMATLWNSTFANYGLWMGKTFEPVSKALVTEKTNNNPLAVEVYDASTTRIGRNFFREPYKPGLLQLASIPTLTKFWDLKERPMSTDVDGFLGELLEENINKETNIPYIKTGGIFLANTGTSVLEELNGKSVYQLNYRWPNLNPAYPMTRLVDELVQIDDGIYLGQLVMATKHYSLGQLKFSVFGEEIEKEIGEAYAPGEDEGFIENLLEKIGLGDDDDEVNYGYQNNGFFLMIDPDYAKQAYADDAFPELRPHPGEPGYKSLGYDETSPATAEVTGSLGGKSDDLRRIKDWANGWKKDNDLKEKFTTFTLEDSPNSSDPDVREMLHEGESILQMVQRIQVEISQQIKYEDHIAHFEKLNRLFRAGVAPRIKDGMFEGSYGTFNSRYNGLETRQWYGESEPLNGFDYYHGATLNLHWGFADVFKPDLSSSLDDNAIFPTSLASLAQKDLQAPGVMDIVWASIGRFIFPWAGKSYEKISGRKLSMLLDESPDLATRYPERVSELKHHPASWPHYDLVKKNATHYWNSEGPYMKHLKSGSWDNGMSDEDKAFWQKEANERWVYGNNIQDARIVDADLMFRMLDMNYCTPPKPLLELAEAGPSPFVRQGYSFLGVSDQKSILPMNSEGDNKKNVFQFHYRYPMVGGPFPIGTCLDELVEIAPGLYLGQLIYSTVPHVAFNTSVNPAEYKYQLFGYFMLMDNDWQYHRLAIGLDTLS